MRCPVLPDSRLFPAEKRLSSIHTCLPSSPGKRAGTVRALPRGTDYRNPARNREVTTKRCCKSALQASVNWTNRRRHRRESGALLLCLITFCSSTAASDWHPASDITHTAESYLEQRMNSTASGTTVAASGFDNRNRLARCDQPLVGFLRDGVEPRSRTIVGVRCPGSRPWKVYVPVDVVVMTNVLVASRALPRGHVFDE